VLEETEYRERVLRAKAIAEKYGSYESLEGESNWWSQSKR